MPHFWKSLLRWGEGRSPLAIALGSGLLMGCTVAPLEAWPLAWGAIAPLWVLVVRAGARSSADAEGDLGPSAWQLGLAWGVGFHGIALSWITGVHPMTWMGVPWLASLAIALFCWIFITLWGAALVVAWAGLMAWLEGRSRARFSSAGAIAARLGSGVALWLLLETLCLQMPLNWSLIAYTQSPHNLAILHLGQLAGPFAVSAALLGVNGLLAEAWLHRRSRHVLGRSLAAGAIALGIALHGVGWALYQQPLLAADSDSLRVGIVQGNVPNTIKLYPEGFRRAIEGYTTGYRTLAQQGVDAVLTPETALPFLWTEATAPQSSLYQAIQESGVLAWVGAFGREGDRFTNSLFTVTDDGILDRYDKVKLVPLGEYIPFESILGRWIDRLSPLDATLKHGLPYQQVDTPLGRAIVGICYESAFPEHFRRQALAGGAFILSASNDAHYSAVMPAQHHAQDIMRAIETDRWAVRAVNTGYSAIVDPHGRTQWISELDTFATHSATIDRRSTQTLYVRLGNWLTPLMLAIALGLEMRYRQSRQQPSAPTR